MEVEKELCESWRVWIDEKNHITSSNVIGSLMKIPRII